MNLTEAIAIVDGHIDDTNDRVDEAWELVMQCALDGEPDKYEIIVTIRTAHPMHAYNAVKKNISTVFDAIDVDVKVLDVHLEC